MSKSIYEQALKIINRNTFELGLEFGKGLQGLHGLSPDERTKIEQALKQAQKQEKLLELYKELITVKDKMIYSVFFDNDLDDISKIATDLEKQIKELEK